MKNKVNKIIIPIYQKRIAEIKAGIQRLDIGSNDKFWIEKYLDGITTMLDEISKMG